MNNFLLDTCVFITLPVLSVYVRTIQLRHAPISNLPGTGARARRIASSWMEQRNMRWARSMQLEEIRQLPASTPERSIKFADIT